MQSYSGVAREEGILTEEEIGAVEAIVMAVSAGRVGAQFREATAQQESQGGCGSSSGDADPDADGDC